MNDHSLSDVQLEIGCNLILDQVIYLLMGSP